MRGADSSTPASGRPRRSRRPGFSYQIRLVGGEAGRRLEARQAAAIAEVLAWLTAHPQPAPEEMAQAGRAAPEPAGPSCATPPLGWPYGLQTRARAVGLVGVGRPVGEVARLVGVHPQTVRRWVRQAARRWADPAGTAVSSEQSTDLNPSGG
jgi:Homeodomain-like domain